MARKIMDMAQADPKGLVRESFAIEGIGAPECRSIFLDWVLSLGPDTDRPEATRAVIARYALGRAGHPMSVILAESLTAAPKPVRRGGRAARMPGG